MISALYRELTRLSDLRQYLLAYSGGIDSHTLLHAMVALRDRYPEIAIRAMHIDHGLNDQAKAWVTHTRKICANLNVPFLWQRLSIKRPPLRNLEARARVERYRALSAVLGEHECLLTAHSQNDQAETLLLQLFRGAGPKGLAAMPAKKPFGHSLHLRPLLIFSRDTIKHYARQHRLRWVEDSSNSDCRFDRNYLRQVVLPLLKTRWPAVISNITRSATHCADTAELMQIVADGDLAELAGTRPNTLSIKALLRLSLPRRINVLRHWFFQHGCRSPSTHQMKQLQQDVLTAKEDAMPVFTVDYKELRRYRDDLFLIQPILLSKNWQLQWDGQTKLTLPAGLGTLHPEDFSHLGQYQTFTLRFRGGGERIKPMGSAYTQTVKKLFQQWGVPPWERDRIPLLFSDNRLLAIVGYCEADEVGDHEKTA